VAGRTTETIHLRYGRSGSVDLELDEGRVRGVFPGPPAVEDLRRAVRTALEAPLDFPPLERAVIPDDRVVLALDRDVPGAETVVAEVWERLASRGVDPARVTILQPADQSAGPPADPRQALPAGVRDAVVWEVHEATSEEEGKLHYLATTAAGERVYLSGTLLDADVVVSVGKLEFDPLLGYRGTNSVFYPGLSTAEAVKRSHGQGHSELGPEDDRPLRQMVDEIGWLLGTQFTVQVVPSAEGGVSDVLAGSVESVFRKGRELVAERWTTRLGERVDTAVVAVGHDAGGHGWPQVAAALGVARRLVSRDGRIVVLSELAEAPSEGIEQLRRVDSPRDVFSLLRQAAPPDLLAATRFAQAVDWARVYLLSRLDSDLVEELFCVPVESAAEVSRLLAGSDESCVFLGSAQHAEGRVG
jgi:nickel-dependent lactate racemase